MLGAGEPCRDGALGKHERSARKVPLVHGDI